MKNQKSSRRDFMRSLLRSTIAGGLFVMTGFFIKRGPHGHAGECSPDLCGRCPHLDRCTRETAGNPEHDTATNGKDMGPLSGKGEPSPERDGCMRPDDEGVPGSNMQKTRAGGVAEEAALEE